MGKRKNPHSSKSPPPGWERHWSTKFGREFFLHVESGHKQWEFPSKSEIDDPIAAKKKRVDAEKARDAMQREAEEEQKRAHNVLAMSYLKEIEDAKKSLGGDSLYHRELFSCVGFILHLYRLVLTFSCFSYLHLHA